MAVFPPHFRPTLAFMVPNFESLRYPVIASPKIDGIRCVYWSGTAWSRTLKPIRNKFIQSELYRFCHLLQGFDGELICGDNFQEAASGIMSESGEPDFRFQVFDHITLHGSFLSRARGINNRMETLIAEGSTRVEAVEQKAIANAQNLMAYEVQCLEKGYEGVMVRQPSAPYKFGRSTEREGYLGKIKRFFDAEGICVGVIPLETNQNPLERDAFGLAKRSTDAGGKQLRQEMGALRVEAVGGDYHGKQFNIGTGFTQAQRISYFRDANSVIGRLVKYKYLPHGSKDLPRHPVFLGFRDVGDF